MGNGEPVPHKANGRPLDAYEREIIVILMEEAAEVIMAASKMLRFGSDATWESGGKTLSNHAELSLEIGDLNVMIARAIKIMLVHPEHITAGEVRKEHRLRKYMQYAHGGASRV